MFLRAFGAAMRRRELITLLGSVAWPLAARAQQVMPTVGIMTAASPTTTLGVRFVINSLKEFGWDENQNYRVVYRWAEGHIDRIPTLVDELVAERVNVIVVFGEAGIQAAHRATKTIPISAWPPTWSGRASLRAWQGPAATSLVSTSSPASLT